MEDSVWNTVMKAPSLPMVIGQTGLPGHRAPGPAEEGCPTETASALIPSKRVSTSLLTSEHLSSTSLPKSACAWAHSELPLLLQETISREAFFLKHFWNKDIYLILDA